MKHERSIFFAISLIAALLLTNASFAAQKVFNADFENDTVGDPPILSPSGDPPGDYMRISTQPNSSALVVSADVVFPTQSLENKTGDEENIFFYSFPDPSFGPYTSGRYEISWTTSLSEPAALNGGPLIGPQYNGAHTFAVFYWPGDNSIRVTDSPSGLITTSATYQVGVAQAFKLIFDLDLGTVDLYIDEILTEQGLSLRNSAGFDRIAMSVGRSNGVRIDDIMIIKDPEDSLINVEIDIKPGSDPNCININSHGVIPVAINGSEDFSVYDIDVESLSFGGLTVRIRGKRGPLCSVEDWNEDGHSDLVCRFEDDPDNWAPGGDYATLTGTLIDGTSFEGTDSICIVPHK